MHAGSDSTLHEPLLTEPARALPLPLRWLLNTASVIYKTVSLILLALKSLEQERFTRAFIISVDNLSFGGTGKTTLVAEIGKHLEKHNIKFAIVTRGYRSRFEKKGTKVQPQHTAADVGDEAGLLKTRFPAGTVYVGKNRRESIRLAVRDNNKIILLDDGFQTTGVFKDLKIMLFNPGHPFYYLRNFKRLMKREDVILSYQAPGKYENKNRAGGKTGRRVLCGTYDFRLEYFCDADGNRVDIRSSSAALLGFSALGDNLRFQQDLSCYRLLEFHSFPDHHAYTEEEIKSLNQRRIKLGAGYAVCTEKDFIKIKELNLPGFRQIPFIYARNSIKCNIDLIGHILKHAKAREENNV